MTLRDLLEALHEQATPAALDAQCVAAVGDDFELDIIGPIEYSRGVVSIRTQELLNSGPDLEPVQTEQIRIKRDRMKG